MLTRVYGRHELALYSSAIVERGREAFDKRKGGEEARSGEEARRSRAYSAFKVRSAI